MSEPSKSLALPPAVAPLVHAVKNGLAVPLMVMMMLAMMVVPLAPIALDGLFTFNIALSICILLAVIYVMRPLDFSVFPSILLVVTLLRLALNVASTRVVLLNGHEGPGAAGNVIEAFGNFVIGGNYAVGIVVFIILTIINFVVVTKGAERISEVSARFTLDSMPGKQMAIDADLNAGLLSRDEAVARREEVREEADFYGSMDGASKFVRGDALAGVLILLINLVGGLGIGMMQHGLDLSTAMQNYTLLTIGDGLVAQLPSLLLATAVAMLVTRMSRAESMGNQVTAQVFAKPQTLIVTATILTICGLIPGMPNLVFLTLGAAAGGLAWWMPSAPRHPRPSMPNSPRPRKHQRTPRSAGMMCGPPMHSAWKSAIGSFRWWISARAASWCVGFVAFVKNPRTSWVFWSPPCTSATTWSCHPTVIGYASMAYRCRKNPSTPTGSWR